MRATWLIAGLLPLTATALAQDAPVVIQARTGGDPAVLVKATGSVVHTPACRGVTWERFDEATGAYLTLVSPPCGPMAAAVRLDEAGHEFAVDADAGPAAVVRAVVVVGEGCRDGVPFPLAGCSAVQVVMGPTLTLRRARE